MSSVVRDPLCRLASSVELWARSYSSSRLWLVTLCYRHTPAGAQTIVSNREREGRQTEALWIVAPRNVFPGLESELHPCRLQRAAESAREMRFSSLCGKGHTVLSSSMRRRSTCQQRRQQRWCAFTSVLFERTAAHKLRQREERTVFEVVECPYFLFGSCGTLCTIL